MTNKNLTRRNFLETAILGVTAFGCPSAPKPPVVESNYKSIVKKITNNGLTTIEHQMYCKDKHFATLIAETWEAGEKYKIFDFRTHPGEDPNGWGSSLYLQPFFPGETLNGTAIDKITATDSGIIVKAFGQFSGGEWDADLLFKFVEHKVKATGTYNVSVPALNQDLNLFKLASNYLIDVPLIDKTRGNTGDFQRINVTGENLDFTWIPPISHFPQDLNQWLDIDMVGNFYTLKSSEVTPAYKPGMKVGLSLEDSVIMFGVCYNQGESQKFWKDNTAVTPLIRPKTTSLKDFCMNVNFESGLAPEEPLQ